MQNKNIVNLEMFHGVNNFNGINHENLVVEGDGDVYVPFVIKQLWFRSVFPKGRIQTKIVGSLEEAIRYKLCVFNAEIYDHDGSLLSGGYGSANATEDNFIEIAERRAVGRALANAGFTWHTGDFSQNNNQEIDVVQSYLQIYNSYINMGVFDTTDVKVIQLYEDAVVTVLPNGYGENSGKPIMAMSENHMSEIAKNYGLINDGEPLINAKIKFVSMYNFFQSMSEKSEISNISTDIIPEVQKATPVADAIPEVQKATPVADAIPEVLQATPVADAVPEVQKATPVADAVSEVLQDAPVADAVPGNTSDFDIDDIFKVQEEKSDVEKETLKKVLARWGYTQEKELIENWKKHLEKIKETSKKVDWTNFVQAKTYIENIPIYKNFLWSEHAKKDEIVLLGDVLNQYKDETIAIVENGTFPLFTLLYAVKWYIHYVWKCTQV